MTVWKCYNGWMGNGPVRVYVIAETAARAQELAHMQYRKEKPRDPSWFKTPAEIDVERLLDCAPGHVTPSSDD